MAKAIEVSEFIEAMVDQVSVSHTQLSKSVARFPRLLDEHLTKAQEGQTAFNRRVAHGLVLIARQQAEQFDLLKSLANQPAPQPRGKAVLSKSEVNEPPFAGQAGGAQATELGGIPQDKICDWLFEKAMAGSIDPLLPTAFENAQYNPAVLPPHVQKALASDLCK